VRCWTSLSKYPCFCVVENSQQFTNLESLRRLYQLILVGIRQFRHVVCWRFNFCVCVSVPFCVASSASLYGNLRRVYVAFFVVSAMSTLQYVVVSSWCVHYSIHASCHPSACYFYSCLSAPSSHPGARSRLPPARERESLVAGDSDFLSKRSCETLVARDCVSLSVWSCVSQCLAKDPDVRKRVCPL